MLYGELACQERIKDFLVKRKEMSFVEDLLSYRAKELRFFSTWRYI
jgi:hypothetical protein